ncbi:UTRA domain-containing protein [Ignatzschineria sp. LJL83]
MAIPKFKSIKNYLLNSIASGEYPPGSQIPTELELSEKFGVSRMTVNRAVNDLTTQNVLTRTAGKGTFVTGQKSATSPANIGDIKKEVLERGNQYAVKVLAQKSTPADDVTALGLGIHTGAKVYYCQLIHYENGLPLILENRYINPIFVPEFIDQDFTQYTPTGYLLEKHGLSRMEQAIEAIACTSQYAKLLEISEGEPCLYISRRTWDKHNIISVSSFLAPGMRYKYFFGRNYSS